MAEVYILGEVAGASGFPSNNLFCKWSLKVGSTWKVIEGPVDGQTQVDHPKDGTRANWSHPIDIHLACKGIQGWPKIYFQVYQEDMFGRHELCGYGFHHIPTVPGSHMLDCQTWRPVGSFKDQIIGFFMGGGPELVQESVIYSSSNRYRLRTVAAGTVHFNVSLITRNFDKFGVEL